MASLSGQTLAKEGVPYYLPIGQFDPSGQPMVASPLIVNGNPYDAYLSASSNITLSARSNGTPLASLSMTSNVTVAIPGMTCNILTLESNLATVQAPLRINTLANPAYIQIGPETSNTSYISNVGSAAPGGINSFIGFNNNGNIYVNGGLVATSNTFYAESAGPSRVITNGTQIIFAAGSGDTPVASLNRTGTTFLLCNAGYLQFASSNYVVSENQWTYTASNGFGMELNPGYAGTTNVFTFMLPGGNTSNNILTDANSMTVNVAGVGFHQLTANTDKLVWTDSNVYQTRTPNIISMNLGNQQWGLAADQASNVFKGYYSNAGGTGTWMTVGSNGAVDFPGGFTVSNISTPSNSSNSIGGITLSNGYLTVPNNISNGSATSNVIGNITLSNGTLTVPNAINSLTISNGSIQGTPSLSNSIGGVLLSNGYMRYASNVWSGWTDSNLRIINRVYTASPPNQLCNLLGYPSIDPQTYNNTLYNSYTWFKLWLPAEFVVDTSGPVNLFFSVSSKVAYPPASPGNGNYLWQSNIGGGGGQIVRWGPTTYWSFPTSNIDNTGGYSNSTYAFGTLFPVVVHKDVFPIFISGYIADPPNTQNNYRVYNGSSGGSSGASPIGDLPLMLEGWF